MKCHHTAFKKDCIKHDCVKWIQIQGKNPQTGEHINDFRCSDVWVPLLLVDVARQLNSLGAAVESERNTIDKRMAEAVKLSQYKQISKQVNHDH